MILLIIFHHLNLEKVASFQHMKKNDFIHYISNKMIQYL